MEVKTARKAIFAGITGIIAGFLYAAGRSLDQQDTLNLLDKGFYLRWLMLSVVAAAAICGIWQLAARLSAGRIWERTRQKGAELPLPFLQLLYAGILLICWLPAFLSIVPGVFSYDAYAEWEQVRTGMITSHHPVIHVLLVGGLLEGFYRLTGSYNVGIGIYTLLQMLFVSNILALTICYLKKRGVGLWGRLLTLLFYGLSPVLQMFAICTTKDVIFSAFELLLMLLTLLFVEDRDHFFADRKIQGGCIAAAFGTMIFRNNGLYIVLLLLTLLFFLCRRYWKRYILLVLGILALYGIYAGPACSALRVTPGGIEEMLSVPIQQLARVYHYDYASLAQEDLELLYQALPRESLEAYKPTVADPVKSGFNREGFEANKKELLGLWIRWGLEHPLTYINSFLIGTVDFWYPGAVMDGYKDPYGRSSYFDYRVAQPGEEIVLLPGLHDFYEKLSWDKEAQQKPLAFLVLSPGWYFLVFLVVFMYLWCYKKRGLLVPLLIPLLNMATVLLGPMALVRYVLILFYAFPLLLALFFKSDAFGR